MSDNVGDADSGIMKENTGKHIKTFLSGTPRRPPQLVGGMNRTVSHPLYSFSIF